MPYDFFMSRYKEAYVRETQAFCRALATDDKVPCTGEDGLQALVMALAAGKSAEEGRWVRFAEIPEAVIATDRTKYVAASKETNWLNKARELIGLGTA